MTHRDREGAAAGGRGVAPGRRGVLAGIGAAALLVQGKWGMARAADRDATLRVLSEGAPNSFDSFSPGVNRQSIQITWNVYDRLLAFGYRDRGDGTAAWDYFDLRGELAEDWAVSADGRTITIRLHEGAVFHDGSPVTAGDVKFSLDRVVASPIGRAQFATGSMTDPAQFVVLDDHTIRIDLPQPDRRALPNLALTYPVIVNSRQALAHATPADPFAMAWLQANPAGSGAFRLAEASPDGRVLFERFDDWRGGPRPAVARVLWQTVPAAETRVAALIRGDADVVQDLPPRDVAALAGRPGVKVAGTPTASFHFIGMNGRLPPFDDVRVRQAVAHALPYEAMFRAALWGRGAPLWGPAEPGDMRFPQPMGYATDPDRARALLAEAGLADGFETTFSYDLAQATVAEPAALLAQEALARVGIRVTIVKIPAGQLGTALQDKTVPFYFEGSTAFIADPDYFFRVFYSGETRWNFGSYANPEFQALVDSSRFETDPQRYAAQVGRMIALAKAEVPVILLWHPALDVGLRAGVEGYSFAVHRMLELRTLRKG
jgi:peptide/nickel transport system substrate-binding protein